MIEDYERKPEWITGKPGQQRFGIQRFGVHGSLWRVVETVTKSGLYIDHGDSYGNRESAARAARWAEYQIRRKALGFSRLPFEVWSTWDKQAQETGLPW